MRQKDIKKWLVLVGEEGIDESPSMQVKSVLDGKSDEETRPHLNRKEDVIKIVLVIQSCTWEAGRWGSGRRGAKPGVPQPR